MEEGYALFINNDEISNIYDKNPPENGGFVSNLKPIGFLFSYNFNTNDRITYSTIYVEKDYRKTYAAAVAGTLFCDYLFSIYDLRKIYAIVYDYNDASKDFLTHGGFVEEGRLKEHRYYNGRYYDMLTLALYRDKFYEKMAKLIKAIKKNN